MGVLVVDHSERDRQQRFDILRGCAFDFEKALRLWSWVCTGHVPGQPELRIVITPEVKRDA